MPRMEGAEATRAIRSALPDTQVLVLRTYADDESLFPALQAGARGYLTKDASAEEIEQAIRALVAGQTHLDPAIQLGRVAAVLDETPIPAAESQPLPDSLTPRTSTGSPDRAACARSSVRDGAQPRRPQSPGCRRLDRHPRDACLGRGSGASAETRQTPACSAHCGSLVVSGRQWPQVVQSDSVGLGH